MFVITDDDDVAPVDNEDFTIAVDDVVTADNAVSITDDDDVVTVDNEDVCDCLLLMML